ncbi:hypothetical protein GCM10011346_47210 [Oceanobacillus neutriphilus]|uniref:YolD-like protein n=1 Tax=Oceanobacillus neutriphilus TaxID=531815 RepID=A0ABQ2P276_9BACI|nr:hypothetical protein GCM10011346_47210 [Oceanobacillus neutriphilus]
MIEKPVLDEHQLEHNGFEIYLAHKQGTKVWIKYFNDGEFKEIVCNIDEPINIWDMIIKCSNESGRIEIPFNRIIQVEDV